MVLEVWSVYLFMHCIVDRLAGYSEPPLLELEGTNFTSCFVVCSDVLSY